MEDKKQTLWLITAILTVTAGYCDAITFVAAERTFSAHITGNFIVFAYQMIQGGGGDTWVKLLTYPVFMLSVLTGGAIAARSLNNHAMLFFEGIILLIGAVIAYAFSDIPNSSTTWPMYLVTMFIIFAMGIQNTFGKLFNKETYGTTTMMTGNSTQLGIDIMGYFRTGVSRWQSLSTIFRDLISLAGFLTGCLLGAWAGKTLGLEGIFIPGFVLVICYYCRRIFTSEQTF
ncbi:YoaK family protein [Pedobacter sp. 22163]|uniref:YoaK family protein n=1 Tax=Pedobacter sp. 22163 TaxID=3453883 RepID=UPI003F85EB9D